MAILGVPLSLGSTVIGVLYAADRTAREWVADEVALLSSFANHAAVALDNARLLDEISAHNEAMRRASDAHDRLADLVLRGGDIPEVAAAVAAVLHGGIVLFDAEGTELARVDAEPMSPPAAAIAASRSSGRSVSTSDMWVCAVLAGPELLGSLVLTGRPALGDADRRLFERASVVTALLFLLQRSVAQAEEAVRGELLADLLTAPARNPGALLARARRLGIDLAAPHIVLIASADGVSRNRLAMACRRYATLVGVQVVLLARTACNRPSLPPSGPPLWTVRSRWARPAAPPDPRRWPPRTPRPPGACTRCWPSAGPARAPRLPISASSASFSATAPT